MEQALNYKTTHFGKWLTRVRLDEVPELFAILKGDMSLIGSHPERVFYSPGVITISLDGPSFPSVAKAGLVGLSPEELTRFLQKPIPNYFKILPKALASLVIIRRIPLI